MDADVQEQMTPWAAKDCLSMDIAGDKTDNKTKNHELARSKIEKVGEVDLTIYTDGSVQEGGINGGAAAIITRGRSNPPEVIDTIKAPAGARCSSYQAEVVAMEQALQWLRRHDDEWQTALIVSDSKSTLASIVSPGRWTRNEALLNVYRDIAQLGKRLHLYCGLEGNELADEAAKDAALIDQQGINWNADTARADIRRVLSTMRDPEEHTRKTRLKI